MIRNLALLLAALPVVAASQASKPYVSPMFSDHMVLQRDIQDPIWGWTTPGAKVTVSIGGQNRTATADSTGKWLAKVGPFKAGEGPFVMAISGPQNTSFEDILIGDVWICSGQSNMEFGVGNLANADQEIAAANYPNIRLFFQPRIISSMPLDCTGGQWMPCTPENLRKDGVWNGFSAVGYLFGKKLNEDLKIPIGLIHTSWGGTPAQAWTSAKDLIAKLPEFKPQVDGVEAFAKAKQQTGTAKDPFEAWYKKNDAGSATEPGWSSPEIDDSSWKTLQVPGFFQKAGVPELVNQMSVVWYRKDVDVPAHAVGKDLKLHFMADDNDTAWVNGQKVGATEGWNTQREYAIPKGLLKEGKNQITIRVLDTTSPGGIYGDPGATFIQVPGGQNISLDGTWKVRLGAAITSANMFPQTVENNPNIATVLYNGMIQPIVPYGVKGAIWYQGESNAGAAYQYRTLLPTMIGSWRRNWGQGNFPFLIVQLAGFSHAPAEPGDDAWAELREAQYMTAINVPNAGIATAIDIGDENDIHPKNKQDVGKRLALVAEAQTYKMKVSYSGPSYRSMKVEEKAIRVFFDHMDGGLYAKGGPLEGFAIAGDDKKWHWASARLDGNSVLVSSDEVQHPVAVRYSWAAFLPSNLYNGAGLPAFPFRTDDWPGITVKNK